MDFKEFLHQSMGLWELDSMNLSKIYKELKIKFTKCDEEVYRYIMGSKEFPSFSEFKETLHKNVSQNKFNLEEGLLILYKYKHDKKTDLIDPETRKEITKLIARDQQKNEYKKQEKNTTNKKKKASIIYTPMGNKR
ncbi:MAG: hypothetical protein CMJ05_06510 [Pelagibacterales bacterium]|nr:hypothetical protein [Pelagibacterales bacterium]|tara:strand:+ start:3769 stop:4176 length:408 start_codon:yes stop_codon:yes gene_type:complete